VRGSRNLRPVAVYFDSDGVLGDTSPNPMIADGYPVVILDEEMLYTLTAGDLEDKILFVDYSLIDFTINSNGAENTGQLIRLMDLGIASLPGVEGTADILDALIRHLEWLGWIRDIDQVEGTVPISIQVTTA
jgi:hypothetical protein